MIAPRDDLELLSERPALEISRFASFCGRHFRRFLKPWRKRIRQRSERKLNSLLNRVERCRDRVELEALLGSPIYATTGRGSAMPNVDREKMESPDIVEGYEVGQLIVELWFRDGELLETAGYAKSVCWDVVCSGSYWECVSDSTDATCCWMR